MEPVFDFITLDNGTEVLKIQTGEYSTTEHKPNFWVGDFDGLLDPGTSTGSSDGNTYVDGSTLDDGATVTGKTLTVKIVIQHPLRAERRAMFDWFRDFLKPKNYILTTDWVGPYHAQYVSFILDDDGKGKAGSDYFSGTLTLVTEEAW